MKGRIHDLGSDFQLSEFIEGGKLIGYFVTGPKAPACKWGYKGRCGGLCAIQPYENGGHHYSVWKCEGEWPEITLKPSVQCKCKGQHGFVRNGVWT